MGVLNKDDYILETIDLKKHFTTNHKFFGKGADIVKAVDGVNIRIKRGEVYGIVGESGCGKSTAGRTIMGLYEATDGKIIFNNDEIVNLNKKKKLEIRRKVQMIFQDPYASLDPRMTVGGIIGEAFDIHKTVKGKVKEERILELLSQVGLKKNHINRYPHEFSGGQRQRIGIARALALEPELIICDEPISALDVSIQAQIVNLLQDLQRDKGLTYIFIAHDLSMIRYICDRLSVMYLGKIAETGDSLELFINPLHPYTRALLSAIPNGSFETKGIERVKLEGDVASPINPPSGCRFRTRCPSVFNLCAEEEPAMVEVVKDHYVACHLYKENYD